MNCVPRNLYALALLLAPLLLVEKSCGFVSPIYRNNALGFSHRTGLPVTSHAPQPRPRPSKLVLHATNEPDPTGLRRGAVLLPLVLLLCIWQFSIPPEFRRARFCTEEQVRLFPDSKCITPGDWASNVQDYYRNGGGIQWDFSIEEED